jgi:integrase
VALGDAKAKAGELRKLIANGVCPITARRAEQASKVTFEQAANDWVETHKVSWKGGNNSAQMKNAKLLLYAHGAPLAGRRVAEISADHVQAALEQLWKRAPEQGRRTLNMFERVFDFAKAKGWRQGDNPCTWRGGFEYRLPRRRAIDRRHHPALPYEEIPAFVRELRQRQTRGCGALALEFAILTCARTSEVLGARWEEIDFDKCLWTIPASRMKAGKEHVVPLSDRAVEILRLQQQYAKSGFVFSGYRRMQLVGRGMWNVLHLMGVKTSVHGFRSTFRNWAGDKTTYARETIEECLAHQIGNAVERAYRRTTALEKRREIMQAWSAYCAGGDQ